MSDTYSQLYIHIVFAVKRRQNLINESLREEVERYMVGICRSASHKVIAIYCMPDHCHLLIGLNPSKSISDFVRDLKSNTSKWINEKRLLRTKFEWQSGYGAFSYSKSHIPAVANYINNQPDHHKKQTFRDEYISLLKKFEIDYKEEYLFDWIE